MYWKFKYKFNPYNKGCNGEYSQVYGVYPLDLCKYTLHCIPGGNTIGISQYFSPINPNVHLS